MYSYRVLEPRGLKSRCRQGRGSSDLAREDPSLPLPGSCRWLPVLAGPWRSLHCGCVVPVSASVFTWPPPCVSLGLNFPLFTKTPVTGFRASLTPGRPQLYLITSSKTPLPDKVPFAGRGGWLRLSGCLSVGIPSKPQPTPVRGATEGV